MKLVYQLVNLYGPLSLTNTQLIREILSAPSDALWQQVKNIVICDRPIMTLRTAVRRISKGSIDVEDTPDAFTLYRAMKYSIDKRKQVQTEWDVSDSET